MGVLKTVEKAVEGAGKGAGKGRKKRRKQLKKAQQLVDNGKKAAEKAPEPAAPKPEAPEAAQVEKAPGTSAETPEAAQVEKAQTKPDDVRTRKVGITSKYNNPDEFMEKSKDKNLGRSERRMLERLGKMRANAQKVFEKGTDKQIKNELGRWGIETKEGARATADEYMEKIDEVLRKKAESGPTLGDKFRSHHGVGLTGLGVVGVSTLDLANSRGQQSNAQLYSDPFA